MGRLLEMTRSSLSELLGFFHTQNGDGCWVVSQWQSKARSIFLIIGMDSSEKVFGGLLIVALVTFHLSLFSSSLQPGMKTCWAIASLAEEMSS